MARIVLFSPVGGTDPISNTNGYDGALLHICRVYKPDMVYMYMSQYALKCEEEDNRYTYCLKELYKKLGKELDYKIIERPDLEEVQEFDFFYDDYKKEINDIMSSSGADDTLLLNTSSGTPAMKSALVVLATLGDVDASLIQVTTPNKKINKHDHDDYDVKFLWEFDPDNEEGFVNRCKIISCPSLLQLKNEELLKRLIRSNDYYAALEVVNMMPEKYTRGYKHLIEYAYSRMILNKTEMCRLEREYDIPPFLPVRDDKYRDVVEYALSLFIKADNGNYADFIRAVSPLIVELFVLLVKKNTGINPYDYCKKTSKNGWKWSAVKLNSNTVTQKWIEIWEKEYKSGFRMGYINSDSLLLILIEDNKDYISVASFLRDVEEDVRNIASHQISTITDEFIKKMTGKNSAEIIICFKKMFEYVDINISKEDWNSYSNMNEYIIEQINSND